METEKKWKAAGKVQRKEEKVEKQRTKTAGEKGDRQPGLSTQSHLTPTLMFSHGLKSSLRKVEGFRRLNGRFAMIPVSRI